MKQVRKKDLIVSILIVVVFVAIGGSFGLAASFDDSEQFIEQGYRESLIVSGLISLGSVVGLVPGIVIARIYDHRMRKRKESEWEAYFGK